MIHPEPWTDRWINAWNARDIDFLLSLYADSIEIRAPFAKIYGTGGVIIGKLALRDYWSEYMRRMPQINLEKVAVYTGHMALAMHCVDSKGRNGIRTVLFDDLDKAVFETSCLDRVR